MQQQPAVVTVDALVSWAHESSLALTAPLASSGGASPPDSAPFRVDAALNNKLSLWRGPIWRLRADAIVNATNEWLRDGWGASGEVLEAAGPQMRVECAAAAPCRTAEAVVTRGCELPARFVIHTVDPKYSAKYHTAAEHALHACYRGVLQAAKERALRSIGVGCIYSLRKSYPREEATHIAARTVRRFLEHYGGDFDHVVFVVDNREDQFMYENVLPLYFPRSEREEVRSASLLAGRDLGDEFGEPIIAERKIRIGALFRSGRGNSSECDDNQADDALSDGEQEDADVAIQQFRTMTTDPDADRVERLRRAQEERQRRAVIAAVEADRQRKKDAADRLQRALTGSTSSLATSSDDFADLHARRFLYFGGVDLSGAPVVVYIASNMPLALDLFRVELFALYILQTAVARSSAGVGSSGHFSILYVHDAPGGVKDSAGSQTTAAATWFSRLLHIFGAEKARHQRALRYVYMLSPSMWLKLLVLVAKRTVSSTFYNKIVYLSAATALDNIAPSLRLPDGVYTPSKAADPGQSEGDNQDQSRAAAQNNNEADQHEGEDEAAV